jgi:hypothetical protein
MAEYKDNIEEPFYRVSYHFSKVLGGEQNDSMLEWLNQPEQAGYYVASLGYDYMTMTFVFTDMVTAFEFKMRFC